MSKLAMLGTLRVRDVMSESPYLLRTTTDLSAAWAELHQRGVSGAPVLDDRGRLVGVISLADLADPRRRKADGSTTVADAMTRLVYAVRPDDPVSVATRLMIDERIHRVVVVDEVANVVGMVVPMDVLRALAHGDDTQMEYFDLRRIQTEG
jgi:CBS-domain-containing membrane protein